MSMQETVQKVLDAVTADLSQPIALPGAVVCTKLITAIACLQLVEQAKITLQDPVTKHLPEFDKVTMIDGSKPKKVPTLCNCLNPHLREQGIISPNDHWMQPDESKIEVHYAGAGLWANAAEYCQALVALLNGGTHPKNGGNILNPESVDELLKEQLTGKLQDDMHREFPNKDPEITNYFEGCTVKRIPKTWALGGLRLLVEHPMFKRSDKNSYCWCDFKDGTCGMIQTQIAPFLDMGTLGALAQIEPQVHAAYAS
ncbi:related to transesterase [Ustilago bromivora]|uniref:Related to transesterase n=1 Tax=Ustilago bromivora TaxID=307758 RepID=A0A8H8QPK9_9BASI|nr:related to transesterase [Ustilago bromivora]